MPNDQFRHLLLELQKYRDGHALHVVVERAVLEFEEADRILLHRLSLNLERFLSAVVATSGSTPESDVAQAD